MFARFESISGQILEGWITRTCWNGWDIRAKMSDGQPTLLPVWLANNIWSKV